MKNSIIAIVLMSMLSCLCLKQRNQFDGKIDWHNMSANKVFNMVRALARPYPGAFYEDNKKKIEAAESLYHLFDTYFIGFNYI